MLRTDKTWSSCVVLIGLALAAVAAPAESKSPSTEQSFREVMSRSG